MEHGGSGMKLDEHFLLGSKQTKETIEGLFALKTELADAGLEYNNVSSDLFKFIELLEELGFTSEKTKAILANGGVGGGGELDKMNPLLRTGIGLTKKFSDGFAELFVRLRDEDGALVSFGEKFKKFARQFLTQIAVMILQAAIFAALLSIVFPGASVGGAGLGGFKTNFLDLLGGGSGVLAGRAKGGPVAGNTPYLVGEQGPELFMSGASGTIIPNHAMGGGSSIPDVRISGNDLLIVFNKAQRRKNLR